MKSQLVKSVILSLGLAMPLITAACVESHKETTKDNWTGGQTHESETVIRNPDGTKTVEKEQEVTH